MKNILFGVALTIAAAIAAERSYAAYKWKHLVDQRAGYAASCSSYLFGPSGARNAHGESLSRQQILDAIMEKVIKESAGFSFDK